MTCTPKKKCFMCNHEATLLGSYEKTHEPRQPYLLCALHRSHIRQSLTDKQLETWEEEEI